MINMFTNPLPGGGLPIGPVPEPEPKSVVTLQADGGELYSSNPL